MLEKRYMIRRTVLPAVDKLQSDVVKKKKWKVGQLAR